MAYQRKTYDEYDIEQQTSEGWEVVSSEATRKAARTALREYRENQPEYPVRYTKHRVKIVQQAVTQHPGSAVA
jgi:hypothetical protein